MNATIEVLFDRGKPAREKLFTGRVTSITLGWNNSLSFHVVFDVDGDEREYSTERIKKLTQEAILWKETRRQVTANAGANGFRLGQSFALVADAGAHKECLTKGEIVSIGEKLNVRLKDTWPGSYKWRRFTVAEMESAIRDANTFNEDCRNVLKEATAAGFVPGAVVRLYRNARIQSAAVVAVKRQVYIRYAVLEYQGFDVRDLQRRVAFAAPLDTDAKNSSSSSSSVTDAEALVGFDGAVVVDEGTLPAHVRAHFQTIRGRKTVLSFDPDGAKTTAFDLHKKWVETTGMDTSSKWLFHGAKPEVTQLITKYGYQNAGTQNGKVFGQGVYFARDLEYSLQRRYSAPDASGRRVILVNRVLVGKQEATNSRTTMLTPGCRSGGDASGSVIMKPYANLMDVKIMYAFVFYD